MDEQRWEYLKNLAPSEPRLVWNSETQGTYRNSIKNQRRKTVRALGARLYKKITKALRRSPGGVL